MNSDGEKTKIKRVRAIDCVDFAVTFAGREYKALLPFILAFHVPFVFFGKLLSSRFVLTLLMDNMDENLMADLGIIIVLALGEWLMMIFMAMLQVVVTGAVIFHVYRLTVFGDRPAFSDALKRGFKYFGMNMILYAIVGGVVYGLWIIVMFVGSSSLLFALEEGVSASDTGALIASASVVGVVVAVATVYLLARWAYTPQFIVCENMFVFAAMRASWQATKKRVWHVICVYVLSSLLCVGTNAAVAALDSLLLIPSLEGSSFVISLVSALLTAASSVSFYIIQASVTFSYLERAPGGGSSLREYELGLGRFFEERRSS